MMLLLERFQFTENSTIGKLSINGVQQCFILEDTDRHLEEYPNAKIRGQTAIPRGEYKIIVDYSPRFRRELPRLLDVPGFEGVRIHPGNVPADTEGCLLPGQKYGVDCVEHSRDAFYWIFPLIDAAYIKGEDVRIRIV